MHVDCAGFTPAKNSHYVKQETYKPVNFITEQQNCVIWYLMCAICTLLKNWLLKICTRRFFPVVQFSARILEILLAFCELVRTNFEPWSWFIYALIHDLQRKQCRERGFSDRWTIGENCSHTLNTDILYVCQKYTLCTGWTIPWGMTIPDFRYLVCKSPYKIQKLSAALTVKYPTMTLIPPQKLLSIVLRKAHTIYFRIFYFWFSGKIVFRAF